MRTSQHHFHTTGTVLHAVVFLVVMSFLQLFVTGAAEMTAGHRNVGAADMADTPQTKSYVYDRIDVVIDVRADGVLMVTETLTLTYTGGPFRYAERAIALQRLDRVRDISLHEDDVAYAEAQNGEVPGTFRRTQTSTHMELRWFYEPTSDATRTFTLRYLVDGAVRSGSDTVEIWWIAVFPDRQVPVEHSQVTMHVPGGARLDVSDVTLPEAQGVIRVEGERVLVTRDTPLPPGESLDVRVRFPAAVITALQPAGQASEQDSSVDQSSRNVRYLIVGLVWIASAVFWWWLFLVDQSNGSYSGGGGGGYSGGSYSGGSGGGGGGAG
jgi:uncharacterized membrane protein YgcG